VIGVRTPALKALAKTLVKDAATDMATDGAVKTFLSDLPHKYFDENQLHAFILSEEKDFDVCIAGLENFLPYVDNWATCDQLSPKVLKKQKFHENVLVKIDEWIKSSRTYTVRFAIKLLMQYFLDDEFKPEYLEKVAAVQSEEYYIKMMVAWYFATALAKQWDATIPFIKEKRLEGWTHNKAIQKAIESYRITPEQKDLLRGMKI
jgi:3-methyladenine DNA glycosylase AlkD